MMYPPLGDFFFSAGLRILRGRGNRDTKGAEEVLGVLRLSTSVFS